MMFAKVSTRNTQTNCKTLVCMAGFWSRAAQHLQDQVVKIYQDPVVQKAINANPRLKINQGVYFSIPKRCSMLIFRQILH